MSIEIDRSKKYKLNAGQCDKCGFFKTWEFRTYNKKTGKQPPGHVTEEGYKVGSGDCPFYTHRLKAEDILDNTNNGSKNETPKATIPQEPVDSGDVAREVLGAPAPTDITPLTNELGKLALSLESINMNTKQLVDAFNVAKSPEIEIDGSLGEIIAKQVAESVGFRLDKIDAEMDALKDKVKENTKKLGKK